MRGPKLNMDNPYPNTGPAQPLQRSLERSDSESTTNTHVNGDAAHEVGEGLLTGPTLGGPNIGNGAVMRPRTAGGLNGTYDELYRSQATGLNVEEGGATPPTLRPSRPTALSRARSDFGPRREALASQQVAQEDAHRMRHGWEEAYTSDEYLSLLSSTFYMYYTDKRHDTSGLPRRGAGTFPQEDWRMRDRLKTVSAALAICLNIGVDPPDVVRTNPSAKLEAWVDPGASTGQQTKVMEQIGKKLQEQYETLSLRTRYKQYLDPSVDETKRFCQSLRRNAKDERILFHYNGHGVPLPTQSGEIWVFNKNYTQYIPIALYDLQSYLGGPSLFVYDVSHAGNIIHNFPLTIEKHEKENIEIRKKDPNAIIQSYSDCIQLAACGRTETLPTNPDLPADLFTCCLTTPIDIAIRFFVLQNPLPSKIELGDGKLDVPGRLQDRRSPLGELNWIFTAITDTIAWNLLPRPLFKKLFRQDLMVAALFRNFLLAERIMRANHCHPMSTPELPLTHRHPLWQSWDLAVEMVLSQLPALHNAAETHNYEYQHSTFFAEQLTAFEVYLMSGPTEDRAPDQLPIVLQVLLSQAHRLRALILLSKFLDLGPWAVHLALSIGIFPYVVKLLQSAAQELKPVMVFIWARIMAVDHTVQSDLLKDNGIHYFISILNPNSGIPVGNASEHRAMCAFIVAIFCKDFPQGQTVCVSAELYDACLKNLTDAENPLLRQWSCLCLSMLWNKLPEAKWLAVRLGAHLRICDLSLDPVPEVRAAMLYALTTFLGIPDLTDQVAQIEESMAASILFMASDGSVLVRKELLVFFSTFAKRYQNKFTVTAFEELKKERDLLLDTADHTTKTLANRRSSRLSTSMSEASIFATIWKHLLVMTMDPQPEVARNASTIVDYIHEALVESPMGFLVTPVLEDILALTPKQTIKTPTIDLFRPATPPRTPPPMDRKEGYLSASLRKSASVAASLRNLAFGSPSPHDALPAAEKSPPKPAQKPVNPPRPLNTPRGRAPPEWTRPPNMNDPLTPASSYHQAKIPVSPGFPPGDIKDRPQIPLESTLLVWSTEVITHPHDDRVFWHLAQEWLDACKEPKPSTWPPSRDPCTCQGCSRLILYEFQYFREPQMKPNEPDEPGSEDYNQRLWRRSRNERIIADNQPLKEKAGTSQWKTVTKFINNNSQPVKMIFHQFEDHLAVTDDRDTVCIWDFQRELRLNRFSNGNPAGSKINDARFINEDDQALLMVGSSDGVLKVFRNYEDPAKVELVTAFRALNELVPSNKTAGLVFDWQQGQGKALVAGDVKVIKVWNAATEVCSVDIPARSSSPLTSLTSDQVAGNIFAAGFGDGCIRVFDQRIKPSLAMVRLWRDHSQWITNVHMQRGGYRELVSGSRNGEVRLWDLRNEKPIETIRAMGTARDGVMRTLSVHEHAPVFAVGGDGGDVRTFNVNGAFLGNFEPVSSGSWVGGLGGGHSRTPTGGGSSATVGGYRRHGASPIVTTAYHPHRMMLGCSTLGDNHVSLITC